jgi:hypothetical protein
MVPVSPNKQLQRRERSARARRGRLLIFLVAGAGVVAALIAAALDGPARTAFGAAAFVLLVTAAYCAGVVWLETRAFPSMDIEEQAPITPPPQSPVTEVYDPPLRSNSSLGRTRDE